jgi:hypothetical protein
MIRISRRSLFAHVASASPLLMFGWSSPAQAHSLPGIPAETAAEDTFKARSDLAQRLTLPVRLNRAGPFQLFVDTGANVAAIADDVAQRLGLVPGEAREIRGIAGVKSAPFVTIDRVVTGHYIRRNMTFAVLPRANLASDGLLGVDWVDRKELTMDFESRSLSIGVSKPSLILPPGVVSMPAGSRDGLLHLMRGNLGGTPADVFIDSGSAYTFANKSAIARLIEHDQILSDWSAVEVWGVTGQMLSGRRALVSSLSFGGLRLKKVPVIEAEVGPFQYWGVSKVPMVLVGADTLKAFASVTLDYRNNAVRFRLRSRPNQPGGSA